jgi:hypothetical protein
MGKYERQKGTRVPKVNSSILPLADVMFLLFVRYAPVIASWIARLTPAWHQEAEETGSSGGIFSQVRSIRTDA